MKLKNFLFFLLCFCIVALPAQGEEVIVSAAASLKDVLTELAPLCLKQTGVTLTTNLAASGILAQQIKSGAPVDIFISADDDTMDGLDQAGLLETGTRVTLLGNTLVFVVPFDSKLKLDSTAALASDDVKHIGIGDPKTVPAGHYATNYFEKIKLLPAVQPKFVPLDNVRTVLAHVVAGNVDVGIVYRTDALSEKKVREVFAATGPDAPVIHYPIAIIKASKSATAAAKVREFLLGSDARAIFARFGFTLPEKPAIAKDAAPAAPAVSAR
jgi:molybdate transport system substrate-binding protein